MHACMDVSGAVTCAAVHSKYHHIAGPAGCPTFPSQDDVHVDGPVDRSIDHHHLRSRPGDHCVHALRRSQDSSSSYSELYLI